MPSTYWLFKWILDQIDPNCPSLENYEDFLPPVCPADYCNHFSSEQQFLEKALICLDELAKPEVIAKVISDDKSLASDYAQ